MVSAGSPSFRLDHHHALVDWMDQASPRLYLPVIAVAEISGGIEKARREGAHRKAQALSVWFDDLLHLYAGRTLSLDVKAARCLGNLADKARAKGMLPGWPDLAIAAIAQAHGLIVLTRNLRHFAPLGIAASDPFAARPE